MTAIAIFTVILTGLFLMSSAVNEIELNDSDT